MVCWKAVAVFYHGILEGKGGSRGFIMVCWKAEADPEGLQWCAGRQGRIQRVYNGMLEGKGGSRGCIMVCWKTGADPEESRQNKYSPVKI